MKIRYVSVSHSLDCPVFTDSASKRTGNAQYRHLGLFNEGSVTSVLRIPGITGLHGGTAKIVQETMEANGETRLSKDQAGRLSRAMKGSTHSDYMLDIAQLAPALFRLKEVDPSGCYQLISKECTYGTGDDGDVYDAQEFVAVVICPSAAQAFFANDPDMLILDMAHKHCVYGGMQASVVTKDGLGHNQRLLSKQQKSLSKMIG